MQKRHIDMHLIYVDFGYFIKMALTDKLLKLTTKIDFHRYNSQLLNTKKNTIKNYFDDVIITKDLC